MGRLVFVDASFHNTEFSRLSPLKSIYHCINQIIMFHIWKLEKLRNEIFISYIFHEFHISSTEVSFIFHQSCYFILGWHYFSHREIMISEKIIQVFTKFSLQADKFYIHLRSIPLVVGFAEFLQHIFCTFILSFELDSFQNNFSHSQVSADNNSERVRKIPCRTRRVYSYCYSRHFCWDIISPTYVFSLYYRFSA